MLDSANNKVARLRDWQNTVVSTVQLVSENPKVKADGVVVQITLLGDKIRTAYTKLDEQSDRIQKMNKDHETALARAKAEVKVREKVIYRARELTMDLETGAQAPGDMDIREIQDRIYEGEL